MKGCTPVWAPGKYQTEGKKVTRPVDELLVLDY